MSSANRRRGRDETTLSVSKEWVTKLFALLMDAREEMSPDTRTRLKELFDELDDAPEAGTQDEPLDVNTTPRAGGKIAAGAQSITAQDSAVEAEFLQRFPGARRLVSA
ncbi:MAG: hypothetical protein ACREHV_00660 [Rhizomicrobium sp.]